jgi:hypothetical protein
MRRKLEHRWLLTAVSIALAACSPTLAQSQKAPSKVAVGSYECWANGAPRLLMNFEIKDGTKYTDSDGKTGTYSYDASSGRITFKGGALEGVMPAGFVSIYHETKGKPTVSYRSPRGAEAAFCEKAR